MLNPLWKYISFLLAALCVILSLAVYGYRAEYRAVRSALDAQNAAIRLQNEAARAELERLKKANQVLVDERRALEEYQRQKDEDAIKAIHDADTRARAQPVRVRVVREAGSCGSLTAPAGASNAGPRQEDSNTTAGVLGPAASASLRSAVTDIKTLQAAFNSCKEAW